MENFVISQGLRKFRTWEILIWCGYFVFFIEKISKNEFIEIDTYPVGGQVPIG